MKDNEFVTADLHLGHRAMLRKGYGERPFTDVDEMNDGIIKIWNCKVPASGAVVYIIGDISFLNNERTEELLWQLNGTLRVIRGNHDRKNSKRALEENCEWVKDYYESKTEAGIKVCMFHYPLLTWNQSHHGSWHLHGHCHGNLIHEGGRRLDVGLDTHPNLEPYSYDEIADLMAAKQFVAVDHHQDRTEV